MAWVCLDESRYIAELGRERRTCPALGRWEAKACGMKKLNCLPRVNVAAKRGFETTSHLGERMAATGANCARAIGAQSKLETQPA